MGLPLSLLRLCLLLAGLGVLAPVLPQPAETHPAEQELDQLAHALRGSKSASDYARLGAFATRRSEDGLGGRAALALAYHDYGRRRYADARRWLAQAERDRLLREYVLYWSALTDRALGRPARAIEQFETLRRDFPESVMTEAAVQELAQTFLSAGKPARALEVLAGYAASESKPALLWLRAQAYERARHAQAAARDSLRLYYEFPLRDESRRAGQKLAPLAAALRAQFPRVSSELRLARAEAFYDARRWREARGEYAKLLPKATGRDRERAALRVAQCRVQLGAQHSALAKLKLADPELDAERLYALAQGWRSQKRPADMLAAVEQVASRYPRSAWAEEALFAAGNYFWVALERSRAAQFYARALGISPVGTNAPTAHWRFAWAAYLERRPEAVARFEEHLHRFPGSPYTPSALFWLGRAAERAGNLPRARGYYAKLQARFPEAYFGARAGERLTAAGAGAANSSEVLALVPAAAPAPALNGPIPPSAAGRWERARALRTIGFDASAELELRAAYAATGSPRFLFEAARLALENGRYAAAFVTARQAYPQLEARRLEDGPEEVWRTLYPWPYRAEIERFAAAAEVDPMLVAGLIRQESTFEADAVSRARAHGLMQVLPKTGRQLARRLKLRYSRARLFQPEYNLRLGTTYLAELVRSFRGREAALAAYNAGEDRVVAWQAERRYDEPAEFVESIPFTETREYVQVVLRNAEIYRRLYGNVSRARHDGAGERP